MTAHPTEGLTAALGVPAAAEFCAASAKCCALALHELSSTSSIAAPANDGAATAASFIRTFLPLWRADAQAD